MAVDGFKRGLPGETLQDPLFPAPMHLIETQTFISWMSTRQGFIAMNEALKRQAEAQSR